MAAVAPIAPVSTPVAEGSLDDRICQFLVAQGHLKETDLVRGRRLHQEDPGSGSLVSLLTRLGLVSEREMAEAVSELLQLPLLSAKEFPDTPPANVQTSVRFLKHHHICPIGESDTEFTLLVADPEGAPVTQAQVTHEVRWEWPLNQPVGSVVVRCGDKTLAEITRIQTAF